jgi:predicted DNA-binding antitoxin AbrB/MazE fold protein
MTIKAIYENGVFRPTEPVALDERTEVSLEIRPALKPMEEDDDPTGWKTLEELIGCVEGGPDDRAEHHDKYIYDLER